MTHWSFFLHMLLLIPWTEEKENMKSAWKVTNSDNKKYYRVSQSVRISPTQIRISCLCSWTLQHRQIEKCKTQQKKYICIRYSQNHWILCSVKTPTVHFTSKRCIFICDLGLSFYDFFFQEEEIERALKWNCNVNSVVFK